MAFKFVFKLRVDAAPHIYLKDLKIRLAKDNYLHPMMKNTLLLMKKTRMSYVRLATTKEIIFVPEKFLHFERALEPIITGWSKIEWTPEEREEVANSPKLFYADILKMYQELGYDIAEKANIDIKTVNEIMELSKDKK